MTVAETRVCRTCGAPKPLTRELWSGHNTPRGWKERPDCRLCWQAKHRKPDFIPFWVRRAVALSERDRRLQLLVLTKPGVPIPDSDPWLDLQVIDCCWSDCIEAGPDATRRMVKKIVAVCWNLYRADDLYAAAVSCLKNETTLATVRSLLDECVGLGLAAG